MVLFGLIKGRNTAIRLLALSWFSGKMRVTIWLPPTSLGDTLTEADCSLPSASGTTLEIPAASTTA